MHIDKAAVNRILPEVLAFLMVVIPILGGGTSLWEIFVWAVFVPFLLLEWRFGHIKPDISINRNILWGVILFTALVLLAGVVIWDWNSVRKGFRYATCALPFFMMLYLAQDFEIRKGFTLGVACTLLVVCGYGFLKWHMTGEVRMTSFSNNPNGLGRTMMLLIPYCAAFLAINKKRLIRFFWGVMLLLACACLLLSGSRGSVLGLVGGLFCSGLTLLVLYRARLSMKQKAAAVCACLLILALGAGAALGVNSYRHHATGGERVIMLEASYRMWEDHKLAGVGQAHWAENYYGPYRPAGQKEKGLAMPHNMVAYYLSTTGIIGTAGYVLYILLTFSGFYQMFKNDEMGRDNRYLLAAGSVVFFAFILHGMVDGTFNTKGISRIYYLLLGYALSGYGISQIKSRQHTLRGKEEGQHI